jgi:hypothetical protein
MPEVFELPSAISHEFVLQSGRDIAFVTFETSLLNQTVELASVLNRQVLMQSQIKTEEV